MWGERAKTLLNEVFRLRVVQDETFDAICRSAWAMLGLQERMTLPSCIVWLNVHARTKECYDWALLHPFEAQRRPSN